MSKANDLHLVTAETDTGGLNTDQYWPLLTQDTYHFCFTIAYLDEKIHLYEHGWFNWKHRR